MLPFSASRRYSTSSNTAGVSTTVASSVRRALFCRRRADEAAPGATLCQSVCIAGARVRALLQAISGVASVGSSATELDRADCHGDGGLRWLDHRDPQRAFQRAAMARHSGATHDDCFRSVLISQLSSDVDHAPKRLLAARRLGDGYFERTLAGEPVGEPHLTQIAFVPGDRARADGYDAKTVRTRERGEDTAFSDAEHRPRRAFAAHVQAGIAIARDHE